MRAGYRRRGPVSGPRPSSTSTVMAAAGMISWTPTPEAFIGACETHARYGTTTLLPTTLAGDDGDLKQTFEAYRQVKDADYQGARMPGLHLEGPYFSAEYKGAQDEKYLRHPSPGDYGRIAEWAMGLSCDGARPPEPAGSGGVRRVSAPAGDWWRPSPTPPRPMRMCWRPTKTDLA